jgi:glycosyltransferase involved in cell wall biosynthesis
MTIPISVVVITYNEERNIGRCLESVSGIADDIVVVDSFSMDGTEEICKGHGARFVQHAFESYGAQKNWAITQARYPHVLSLDADEAVSPALAEEIQRVKENWRADGYEMNRRSNYCGTWIRHGGWYPDRKLRLWDSRKGRWEGDTLHERYVLPPGSKVGRLKGDILHYSYYTVGQHVERIQRYTDLDASVKYERGRRIPVPMIAARSTGVFLKKYLLRLGILDGYYGFVISVLSAYATFLKDVKLRELHRKEGPR